MDEAQRQATLRRLAAAMLPQYDPTIGMSGGQRFFAGMGSGMTNLLDAGRGAIGMERSMSPEEKAYLDRWLNATQAGRMGTTAGEALPSLLLRR